MRNLIPNDITVSEQFKLLGEFNRAVHNWYSATYGLVLNQTNAAAIAKQLEEDFGISCVLKNTYGFRALSPKVVDERKYLFFMLRYQ